MSGADLTALIKKHPVAFIAGFICIGSVAWWYTHMGDVETAQQEFVEKDEEARKMSDNVRNSAGLDEQTAQMKEAGRQFESRLVRAGQLATNLQFFYRLETETGVKLLDVRQNAIPAPKAGPRGAYSPVPFSISIQGTHDQVLGFLRRLETSAHFARFGNVTFSKSAGSRETTTAGSGPGQLLNVSMTVEMLGTP